MRKFTLIFAALLFTTNSYSEIITVKKDGTGNFTSIQEAYMAASSGDTVLVYPGIYYENIFLNVFGKHITIASLNLTSGDKTYISNTVIDGNKSGSVIRIKETETTNIVIHGFTLRNGSGHGNKRRGGAINIDFADASIINCIVEQNTAFAGGGFYLNKSLLYLSGVTIRTNHAYNHGGGIFLNQDVFIVFDTINKSNIYLNHSATGADYAKSYLSPPQSIVLDTFTVAKPDYYYIRSGTFIGFPANDLIINIANGFIEPIKSNLYVNPVTGSDYNSGLNPDDALKTIDFAYKKILPDTVNSNTIFLANGIYSASRNGERFPVQARSYVNLIGESVTNTLLDAEESTFLYNATNLCRNYLIENITFINGYGDASISHIHGGLLFNYNEDIILKNISVKNCKGYISNFDILHTKNSFLRDINLSENTGGFVHISYSWPDDSSVFKIHNMKISDNYPYYFGNDGLGGGLTIKGNLSKPGSYKGDIVNLQITNNLTELDPEWGPAYPIGVLAIHTNVTVDIINATIGNNVLRGREGYAVGLVENAVLNLYNSILYADSLYEMVLGDIYFPNDPVTANICYSNIEGGQRQIYNWYNKHTLNWLEGNIDSDPEWIGEMPFPYQLRSLSPCINAGTPMYEQGMLPPYIKMEDNKIVLYKIDGDTLHLPLLDLAGNPRISAGRIDMGAYEFQDTGTYVLPHKPAIEPPIQMSIYPNPFFAHAFINFELKKAGEVTIVISDLNGRTVKTLLDAQSQPGEYNMIWKGNHDNGNTIPKGTYFVKFYYNDALIDTRKIVRN